MPDITQTLENCSLTISYHDFYKNTKSIKSIVKNNNNIKVFYLLALLEFSPEAKRQLRNNILESYQLNKQQFTYINSPKYILNADYSLSYLFYYYLTAHDSFSNTDTINFINVFDSIIKANDLDPTLSSRFNRKQSNSILAGLFYQHYQDNPVSMFKRSNDIFINSSKMNSYRTEFRNQYSISFKDYIYYLHFINVHLDNLKINSSINNVERFCINVSEITQHFTLNFNTLHCLLNLLSFTQDDICKISKEEYINLIRSKPFYKVNDNIYIPINRKFVSELVFVNSFHKLLNLSEDKILRSNFLTTFGEVFEDYVISLAKDWNKNISFKFIPEFIINNNDKSPDLLLIDKNRKEVIVFEVKSARVLKKFIDSYLNYDSYLESIKKQISNPFSQSVKSINNIIRHKKLGITQDYSFFYCSITFDSFPFLPSSSQKIENEFPKDFINISIEGFEVFIRLITSKNFPSLNISPYKLLLTYKQKHSDRMSPKTFFTRFEKHYYLENTLLEQVFLNSQLDYMKEIQEIL